MTETVQDATQPLPIRKAASESGLKLTTILSEGSEALARALYYYVYEAKKDVEGKRVKVDQSGDAAPLFRLPAGRYYVVVEHGSASVNVEVEVTAGEQTEQTLNLNAGYLRLSSIAQQDTEPVTRDLYYYVYEAKKDVEGKRVKVDQSGDAAPLFRLPAGRYYVLVEHGSASANIEVEVTAGEQTEQTLNLNAGYLRLSCIAQQDAEPVTRDLYYYVYEAKKDRDGKRVKVDQSGDTAPLFRLPAGRYYVLVEHRGANASAEIEITSGQREEITLEITVP